MEFSLFGKLLIFYLICKTVSCNFTLLFITCVNQYSPHYVTPDFDSLQLPPEPDQQRIPARRGFSFLLNLTSSASLPGGTFSYTWLSDGTKPSSIGSFY